MLQREPSRALACSGDSYAFILVVSSTSCSKCLFQLTSTLVNLNPSPAEVRETVLKKEEITTVTPEFTQS